MCYAQGSIDQAVNPCPMCKVFPHTRCPHVRDVCRNRTLHPRFDVLYLKNAEVDSFNGCGYCKWARTNPPPKLAGYHNPGWPGCCRAPQPAEYRLIQAADWRSVSVVHHVPIPPDIKAALDSLSIRGSPIPALSTNAGRGSGSGKAPMPSFDRKNSGNSSPSSRTGSLSGKTANMAISGKGRSGGSPKQLNASLGASLTRTVTLSSSVPNSSAMEQHQSPRRQPIPEFSDKRAEGTNSLNSSPNRKHVDLETSTPKRVSSVRRTTASPSRIPSTLASPADRRSPDIQMTVPRRSSISSAAVQSVASSTVARVNMERPKSLMIPRVPKKDDDALSSASSGSGSSDGLGSQSDSTVTSDGGFTDYLSDESEAELQRQAEARAALVAQNQAEELEFKAARQQLAHIDLQPPKTWNPTNITNSTAARVAVTPAAKRRIV
ncbi:hypothetical protein BDQ12DRAFT_675317 [Crucibulum laeve]|uniref:Uncharacterized protein n=1 Tax=Crucibulum laeve TaxID=68775 RepID=A0A5C3MQX1_9AGAR|nr:hypothetical protein BDQ12DRAFT_675317 [Crucibulum laeve]